MVPKVLKIVGETAIKVTNAQDIIINGPCIIGIDGSTTCSGIAVKTLDGELRFVMSLYRSPNETAIQYKVAFKRFLLWLFNYQRNITKVFYEEPYIGYVDSSKVLITLASSVEELVAENEPNLNYLKYIEVNNKKWKMKYTGKVVGDTEKQKKDIRDETYKRYPFLLEHNLPQDVCDAIGVVSSALVEVERHSEDSLKSQGRVFKFNYDIRFIGADSEEEMLHDLDFVFKQGGVPKKLIESWFKEPDIIQLSGKGLFNDHVYRNMGGDDTLLVFEFPSGKYSNILLEHGVCHIASGVSTVYAVVWRQKRKAVKKIT